MARIKVTPAEEDEVIVAGITSNQPLDAGAAVDVDGTFANDRPAADSMSAPLQASTAAEPAPLPGGLSAQVASQPSSDSPAVAERQMAVSANQRKRAKSDYQETTLEDLEPTSMPLAQRIVIVAAVVCIIGALVYYFVAMR